MKKSLILVLSALTLVACGTRYPEHSLILNSKDALVETTYGTLCGYIEDGIYTFKGIDYAKANRFEAPQNPNSWEGVQPAVYANADMRYKMGDTKQYLYIFNKPSTVMDGTFGTNHCTEMPFVFNNIWLGRFMVGCDKSAYKLADFMSDVWVSFARNGVPDVKKFKWEVYNPETKPMVVFQDKTVTVHAGDAIFDDMAAYKAENWVFRQPYF